MTLRLRLYSLSLSFSAHKTLTVSVNTTIHRKYTTCMYNFWRAYTAAEGRPDLSVADKKKTKNKNKLLIMKHLLPHPCERCSEAIYLESNLNRSPSFSDFESDVLSFYSLFSFHLSADRNPEDYNINIACCRRLYSHYYLTVYSYPRLY